MSDIEVDGKTLGQLAFEAYRAEVGGNTFDDKPIPAWDELHGDRARVHRGWEAAAAEVARWVRGAAIIDKAMEGPFVRRERPSRWEPLNASLPPAEEPLPTGSQGKQVGGERAAQAAGSVPVVAEADDGQPG